MSIGNATSTCARFVYAAPKTRVHMILSRGEYLHLPVAHWSSGSTKIDKKQDTFICVLSDVQENLIPKHSKMLLFKI